MSAGTRDVLDYSWLHDDLEDDVVGADWHQNAIRALSTSLKMFAGERGWSWHVGDQLTVIAEKPDTTEWRPCPDVSIHSRLGPADREYIDVRADGPPSLVIEVASASTWQYDVSLERTRRGKRQAGKAFGYLSIMRVPEYLVFDPHNQFLTRQIRAWQRLGDTLASWQPDADGHYRSRTLPVSFAIDGPLLRVFDPDGQPVPYWFEVGTENGDLRQRNLSLEQRVADLEAEVERLRHGDTPS